MYLFTDPQFILCFIQRPWILLIWANMTQFNVLSSESFVHLRWPLIDKLIFDYIRINWIDSLVPCYSYCSIVSSIWMIILLRNYIPSTDSSFSNLAFRYNHIMYITCCVTWQYWTSCEQISKLTNTATMYTSLDQFISYIMVTFIQIWYISYIWLRLTFMT